MTAEEPIQTRVHIVIEPKRGWSVADLKDLWEYRELLYFLARRDISVRYKQTVLGVFWALVQPLFTMVVFSVIFGQLARIPSGGVPYPVFSFAALLPWQYFSAAVANASNSLVSNASLISKVYFPRLAIPLAGVLPSVVDFFMSLLVLFGMMLYYGLYPSGRIVWIVPLLLMAVITSLGVGLWLSALNVWYRDIRNLVPFLMQALLYASPVVYPSAMVPARWQALYGLNPMAGIIEGFRWALLGTETFPWSLLIVSVPVSLLVLVSGLVYFRSTERTFADVV